ncbi:MAG: prolyl oligopeptidase family serine peptidase [Pirellulales bacterium]
MSISSTPTEAQDNTAAAANPLTSLFEPREYSDASGNTLKYRLMKPADYNPNRKYPLVLFLHGAGERGSDNFAQLKHGMKEFTVDERRKSMPCYVMAPQCPTDKKWVEVDWSAKTHTAPQDPSVSIKLTMEVIESMLETSGVDKSRVYITGLSMGGYGTWDTVARYPKFFAAAAPICGGGDPATAPKFASLPLWAFHGGKDTVVIPERSRDMIDSLKKAGGSPRYTEYPDAGHDSWTATYASPEFHQWLFAQRRKLETSE